MSPSTESRVPSIFLGISFITSITVVVVIFFFLLIESYPVFRMEGFSFLTGRDWIAGTVYGALPMVYGTLVVTAIAVCFALPIGLGGAIVTSEFLSGVSREWVKTLIELLAGVPGVVFGLIGIFLLTTSVKNIFGLLDGNTLLTAGILLGIMTLPTILSLSDDALQGVPRAYREEALALGLTRAETILHTVLPAARKGILGAVLLGISRAMGETIAVMLVVGSVDRIPSPLYNFFQPGQTITSKLGREAAEALGVGLHWNALAALGFLLFLMVVSTTLLGNLVMSKRNSFNAINTFGRKIS